MKGVPGSTLQQIAAYWTPPSSWPRRFLCEGPVAACFGHVVRNQTVRNTRTLWAIAAVAVMTYLAIMDIVLYGRFQQANLVHESKHKGRVDELYSPFTHLSVKTLMLDEPSQFLKTPLAEYFNAWTRFSDTFPFITPNVISVAHLITGFLAGKFIASSLLKDRRIGVALFCFRNWLDALDGTVFRAQSNTHLEFRSHPATSGYFIDAGFDMLGGFFLCFGILFYLLKRFGPKRYRQLPLLPQWKKTIDSKGHISSSSSLPSSSASSSSSALLSTSSSESSSSSSSPLSTSSPPSYSYSNAKSAPDVILKDFKVDYSNGFLEEEESYSVTYLFTKVFILGMCLGLAGLGWNYAMQGLTKEFQTAIIDENLSLLQFEYSHSFPSIAIFVGWRLLGSMAMLNYIMLAIYFDCLWGLLNGPHLLLLGLNSILLLSSYFYIHYIQSLLQL